jgi:hypothetical protein
MASNSKNTLTEYYSFINRKENASEDTLMGLN